jgi:predicted TIM-barrel fold metal-dependent hydrolase
MEVIDSHAHIFPFLGGKCGYSSVEEHMLQCQRAMHEHLVQPVCRAHDHYVVEEETLWDPTDSSLKGRFEVDFQVGRFGRFEWRKEGVSYYIQYFPPSMQDMEAPPEWLKVEMEYAGVSRAVLQCGSVYGKLNHYYSMILQEFPETFLPLARVEENQAYTDEEIERFYKYIKHLGLRGLWFAADETHFGPQYKPFWDEVARLHIPVFFAFYPEKNMWIARLRSLRRWVEDYPEIPCVLPQAFPLSPSEREDRIAIPHFAKELIENSQLYLELCYPIGRGRVEDYPYPRSREAIKQLYETFGPRRLVWGSDFPMVERFCTYAQSLNYLKDHCDFILPKDMELILGGNLKEIFQLGPP